MEALNIEKLLEDLFISIGVQEQLAVLFANAIGIISLIVLAVIADFIAKRIILAAVSSVVKRTKNTWDDLLVEKKVFNRLAHIAPALVFYLGLPFALSEWPILVKFIKIASQVYIVAVSILVADSFVNVLSEVYSKLPFAKSRPIKGYVQVVKIILYFIGIILIISLIIGESPEKLLTGLGAMAAVILLVFKDTILGFVASIQLSANNMVTVGDWIEMPSHKADGTVLEITLNTVKVQNWDKTISTIPTYALVAESFQNWRGMEQSGGRRIKRSINIDMSSVKFCDEELLTKLKKVQLINNYIDKRQDEIDSYNNERGIDVTMPVNGRRMTNLGLLRRYVEEYLHGNSKVHDKMTFLVRHLQPTEKGIPLEIYVFSRDQEWAAFESLQADIFDHIIAAIPHFDLRIFQNPTGADFQLLAK